MKPLGKKQKILIGVILAVCFGITFYGRMEEVIRGIRISEQRQEQQDNLRDMRYELERERAASIPEKVSIEMEDGTVTIGNVKLKIPTEFEEYSEGRYMAPDSANIVIMTETFSVKPTFQSEQETLEEIQNTMKEVSGFDMAVTIKGYEPYEISGCDALRYYVESISDEIEIYQTHCIVVTGNMAVMIVYTQEGSGAWDAAFDKSIASITIE